MNINSKEDKSKKRVFVAMSGGVDSSVAAAVLKEQGYDVVGITMCFNISYPNSRRPSCCGIEGIEDAKRVAQILDIPHHVLNFAEDIKNLIIEDFTNEYLNGRTPNPCVRCNQYLKFGVLYDKAMALGADYIATGHYVKNCFDSASGRYKVKKATDEKKDQTYFLYGIKRQDLPKLLFPLADITKEDVRKTAEKYGLKVANKAESQDICFVPDTGYKQFIKDCVGEDVFIPGPFKDHEGDIVGEHKGIANYTIGQRDKLGIALGHPVYVFKIDKDTNTVYVGPDEFLYSKGLFASQSNFVSIKEPKETIEAMVRIRYNAKEVEGFVTCLGNGKIKVDFKEPQKSVTPGQSVVFYKDDVLLGGAVIEESF